MKINLTAKIFIAFFLVSITGISMLVTANAIFSNKNFESFIRFKVTKTLSVFSKTLAEFCRTNGSWAPLASSPELWTRMVQERWPDDTKIIRGELEDEFLGSEVYLATEVAYSGLPDPPTTGLYPHLVLFDCDKKRITGEALDFDEISPMAIYLDGETVGWVGVELGDRLTHPLDRVFMEAQSRALFTIGGLVLLLSVVIAFILTRHLLSPIKWLSEATQFIADRKFTNRITKMPKDELGTLAIRFNKMAEKLAAYEQKQQQWLADISHELRTPLSVLGAEVGALLDGIRKPDRSSLASLYEEIKYLIKIVNDLHFISLSESGNEYEEMETVKPIPILSQTVYMFTDRLEKNGMSVKVDLEDKSADLQIRGNTKNLTQLFRNLLENSLKHTDKPGTLFIYHRQTRETLNIVFEDTGPGVPMEALPRLFDRLYRTDPSRSRKTGSSGLGLAICKTIIEKHGGGIVADNSEKGGLKIEIVLPLLPRPAERSTCHENAKNPDR
jgi:two-component system sensor histidine kinase BaeS